ncbi:hypothetical protein SSX86_016109 [Deinandra increscens subsp. villosa]|uniref:Uncharacterized protein n=1 Tax=Deinandra increscens subsp. villosa TaxID=3103831 RepID=A0AAP0D2P3_9ASTR
MGACISIHHKASAVKAPVPFDSALKPDHTSVIHPSPPSAGKPSAMDELVAAVKPQLFPSPLPAPAPAAFSDYGSKEETFFESQAWLDSDYEDEFMSVNGEFTPSRSNTPVHPSLTRITPRLNMDAISFDHTEPPNSTSEPSPTPTEKRRRLLDLFKESVREKNDFHIKIVEQFSKDGQMGSEKDGMEPKSESQVGYKRGCFMRLISIRSNGK